MEVGEEEKEEKEEEEEEEEELDQPQLSHYNQNYE